MENKKQLVIVPPVSDALQKLNEVLKGIADEENIEISIIDEVKELNQFIGSAGQSLILFSNPKRCAMFLQENRFLIARAHSKVILLTPKEIPVKTLIKFNKLGLTESLLESSPPKTLLYKVKLLLRSIKSSSMHQEEKDHIVKSMLDLNQTPSFKREALAETTHENGEISAPDTAEMLSKNESADEVIENKGNVKAKNTYQEEAIDTNWKSNRKKDSDDLYSFEKADSKVEAKDSDNIDIYYRGKKKNNQVEISLDEADTPLKKNLIAEVAEEDLTRNKKYAETNISLFSEDKSEKKSNYSEEEEGSMAVTRAMEFETDITSDEKKTEQVASAEEIAAAKKKEFDELEALFAAAKEKLEAREIEDLGGYLKGKVGGLEYQLEKGDSDEEDVNEKEYDNSDLYKREKQTELSLDEATPEEKKKREEYTLDISKEKKENEAESFNGNMTSESGPIDRLTTNMMSEMGEDGSKKIKTQEFFDLARKAQANAEEEEDDYGVKKSLASKNLFDESDDQASEEEKADYEREEDAKARRKEIDLNLERATNQKDENEENSDASDEIDNDSEKLTSLQFEDGEKELKKDKAEDVGEGYLSVRKMEQVELDLERGARKGQSGSVDKIDTFYRSGDSKKTEHSWDNLFGKKDIEISKAERKTKGDQNLDIGMNRKDLGEITIDYRMLKEEFDQISRNGRSDDEASGRSHLRGLNDSEDAGTFKVIEINARGFEFSIEAINLLYQKETKPTDFYKKIAEEMISSYHAYPVFYAYKTSDQSHSEAFDSFMQFGSNLVSNELKEWWINTKTDKDLLAEYFLLSMTTWMCRDIPDTKGTGFWQDVELPSWASNELADKKVEMVFPYYDGVDRMGTAIIFFPEGIKADQEQSILVTLELVRTLFLESIQRTLNVVKDERSEGLPTDETKKTGGLLSGLFNRKKAG